MLNFTKGEWKVKDRWNVLAGKRLVANCGGYSSSIESVVEENEANAQLISASPDLYEALKQLRAIFGDDRLLDDVEFRAEVLIRAKSKGTDQFVQAKIKALENTRRALAKVDNPSAL